MDSMNFMTDLPPSSNLSHDQTMQLKHAPLDELVDTWLPLVCRHFHPSDFMTLWQTFEAKWGECETSQEANKHERLWRAALKVQSANVSNQVLVDMACTAFNHEAFNNASDLLSVLVKRHHNALNEQCAQNPLVADMLMDMVSHALEKNKVRMLTVVCNNLNDDNKHIVCQSLLGEKSPLAWRYLDTSSKAFVKADQALSLLWQKVQLTLETALQYPLDQLYDGQPERHPWFQQWDKGVEELWNKSIIGDFFDNRCYLNPTARLPTPQRPDHLLHKMMYHEAMMIGSFSFVVHHGDCVPDHRCQDVFNAVGVLRGQNLDVASIDQEKLAKLKARATWQALDKALPEQPQRPRILKKI